MDEYHFDPMNELANGLTLLQVNPDCAADLRHESPMHRWLYVRHPDGQWVTFRKMSEQEFDQAWDQSCAGEVRQGTKVRVA